MTSRKSIVVIPEGIGDALVLIPMLRMLKSEGYVVDAIFSSAKNSFMLFPDGVFFNRKFILPEGSKSEALKWISSHLIHYDLGIIHFMIHSAFHHWIVRLSSKHIITNQRSCKFIWPFDFGVKRIPLIYNVLDSLQAARLLDIGYTEKNISADSIALPLPTDYVRSMASAIAKYGIRTDHSYVAIQICSANNSAGYKNWPICNWISLLKLMMEKFRSLDFILLGDSNETGLSGEIKQALPDDRIIDTVGKTDLSDAMAIILNSSFYLGLDSGLMHIAATLGRPTFSIWGGSDYNLYGYHKIDPVKHHLCFTKLDCHPCNSWLKPNRTRVKNPCDCPDNICIRGISPDRVFTELTEFMSINRIV